MTSSIAKEFEVIPPLAANGADYRKWRTHIDIASEAAGSGTFLEHAPVLAGATADTAALLIVHSRMVNAITQ